MLQGFDARTVAGDVAEQRSLADLEREGAGLEVVGAQRMRELDDEVVGLEVAARHVDRDRQRPSRCLRAPGGGLAGGLVDDVAPEPGRHLAAFDGSEEVARPEEASCRVVPPHQGFDTAEAAVVQVDDRLVRQEQFVPVEGALQLLVGIGERGRHELVLPRQPTVTASDRQLKEAA